MTDEPLAFYLVRWRDRIDPTTTGIMWADGSQQHAPFHALAAAASIQVRQTTEIIAYRRTGRES